MSFQGYQGEVNPQGGPDSLGPDVGTQLLQLSQVQLERIVSSAVSQALTQQIQHMVQPVQTPIKFDVPTFEDDGATSLLTLIQRVEYQARAWGFEAELTGAESERLGVRTDVFDGSNVGPATLRMNT